jgi:HEAT repeat protein
VTGEAPLKSAVFGHALMGAMKDAPANGRSIFSRQFANRVAYTQDEVLPKAWKVLDDHIAHSSDQKAIDALALYGFIGSEQHVPRLAQIAKNSHHPQMAAEALSSAYGLARSPETRFKLLVDLAQPGSQVQEDAQMMLEALPDPRAKAYSKFIDLRREGGNLKELVGLIGEMPNTAGKEMVFAEALRVAGANNNVRNAIAVRVMQTEPHLRGSALDQLSNFGDSQAIKHIEPYTRHADRRWASMAKETINQINLRDSMAHWEEAFAGNSQRAQLDAVNEMSALHDNKIIKPLLKAATAEDPTVRARAIQALGHYTPALVKFEARSLGQMKPEVRQKLETAIRQAV